MKTSWKLDEISAFDGQRALTQQSLHGIRLLTSLDAKEIVIAICNFLKLATSHFGKQIKAFLIEYETSG